MKERLGQPKRCRDRSWEAQELNNYQGTKVPPNCKYSSIISTTTWLFKDVLKCTLGFEEEITALKVSGMSSHLYRRPLQCAWDHYEEFKGKLSNSIPNLFSKYKLSLFFKNKWEESKILAIAYVQSNFPSCLRPELSFGKRFGFCRQDPDECWFFLHLEDLCQTRGGLGYSKYYFLGYQNPSKKEGVVITGSSGSCH